MRVRFAGAGAVLVRVKILRCGFVSAGAGAAKFFGAGNNINDLSKFFGAVLLVRMNKDTLLNFRCIDSTFFFTALRRHFHYMQYSEFLLKNLSGRDKKSL